MDILGLSWREICRRGPLNEPHSWAGPHLSPYMQPQTSSPVFLRVEHTHWCQQWAGKGMATCRLKSPWGHPDPTTHRLWVVCSPSGSIRYNPLPNPTLRTTHRAPKNVLFKKNAQISEIGQR